MAETNRGDGVGSKLRDLMLMGGFNIEVSKGVYISDVANVNVSDVKNKILSSGELKISKEIPDGNGLFIIVELKPQV